MAINISLYDHYFLKDELEGDSKGLQEKWYIVAIKCELENFKRQLENNDHFKRMKIYKLMTKMSDMFSKYVDFPQEWIEGKLQYEYYDVVFDVIAEKIENKKCNSIWKGYDELIDEFENYFLIIDEWNDLVYLDYLGETLSKKECLIPCVELKELIEDINYYNSIRSNPLAEHVSASKALVNELYSEIKTLSLDEETKYELKEYLKSVKAYLNIINKLIIKNDLKKSKINKGKR